MPRLVNRRHFGQSLLASAAPLVLAAAAPLWLSACGRRDAAPEVGYTLLDGRSGHLAAHRNKVVLVNFWATSCATCVAEMPALVATWRRFEGRGYETIAVAMRHDPPALVARYAQTQALPFAVAIDNMGAIARAFGNVRITPTTFVIDKRGGIAARFEGAPDFARLHRLLDELLAEPA